MRTIVLALFLGGCAFASETYTPNGQKGYSVTCSGAAASWANCFEKAGELCGSKGYDVLDRGGDSGFVAGGGGSSFFAGSTYSRAMLIRCK